MTRISQHHSCGSFYSGDNGVLQDLMSKACIRGNLTGFTADIAAVKQTGLTYVLGETNSFSCHGAPGVSNTAGAALWAWIAPCLQATSALLGYISIKASVISTISYGVILSEARDRSGTICQQVELLCFSFSPLLCLWYRPSPMSLKPLQTTAEDMCKLPFSCKSKSFV
jgi:hypothetical protein